LDEFDKTPSHFHSAFYQLFDEGIYEDKNYHVNVEKSIIICTSNYNSLEEIREHLGEPIFTRFNDCIEFAPLDNESKAKIIHMRLDEEYKLLTDEEKEIISKKDVLDKFLKIADKQMNARKINTLIKTYISRRILEQYVADSSKAK
jgi:ATP-dependent Clp protease ATP-binding subunit ClpA